MLKNKLKNFLFALIFCVTGFGQSTINGIPAIIANIPPSAVSLTCISSSANSLTYTCPSVITSYSQITNTLISWIPDVNGAGGSTTLNFNSLGPIAVKEINGTSNPLSTDIVAHQPKLLIYNGTNFLMVSSAASNGGINSQTTSYLLTSNDAGHLVVMNGSSLTATLPSSPPSAIWTASIQNLNATALILSRNGLNINGVASNLTLQQYQTTTCYTDGSNYFCTPVTIPNSYLTNSAVTVNGVSVALGASGDIDNTIETWVVGTGGVTANTLVNTSGGTVIEAITSSTDAFGIAQSSVGATGSVLVTRFGVAQCVADNTITQGDLIIVGTGTGGDCKDSGQTSSSAISIGVRIIGIALTGTTSGNPFTIELTPAHFGTLVNFSNLAGTANLTQVPLFVTNAQTATYQVLAADFTQCKTIPVASGTFTITLVASGSQPASGQCIQVINYGSGVVTIARSGQNINGGTSSLTLAAATATTPTGALVVSDGTNYEAALFGAGTSLQLTQNGDDSISANFGLDWAASTTPTYNSGGTTTVDFSQSNTAKITMSTGNSTLAVQNQHGVGLYGLEIIQDSTCRSFTYPGSFISSGAGSVSQPSCDASSITFILLWYDGTNFYQIVGVGGTPTAITGPERAAITTTVSANGAMTFDSGNHTVSYYANASSNKHIMPRTTQTGDQLGFPDLTAPPFVANAQTATYQVLAADFAQCKTIPVASGTFTITLVASGSQPASGQCVIIINYGSGVVTIARSGQNINGGTSSLTLTTASGTAPTGALVVSDGTNYEAALFGASSAAVNGFNGSVAQSLGTGSSPITETWTVGTGGVTQYHLVQTDTSAPTEIIAASTGIYGIAMSTVSAAGSVEVARYGTVNCVTDTGGSTAGDLVIIGTGTVTDCKDSGQTLSVNIAITARIIGVFRTSVSAGANALVELTPAHFGTQVTFPGLASPPFVANAQTSTYQALAADFAQCKTIPVASGTFTITLVASGSQPPSGQCIDIINYGTGVVTVARSGQNLNGGTASLTIGAGSATAPTGAHVVSDGTNYEMALWTPPAVASQVYKFGGSFGFPGSGTALASTPGTGAYMYSTPAPAACTIQNWSILVDAGTATVKFVKVASGTALPTVGSNSISTSGVAISSGTVVDRSSTLTDFTTTAVSQGDVIGVYLSAVASADFLAAEVECK